MLSCTTLTKFSNIREKCSCNSAGLMSFWIVAHHIFVDKEVPLSYYLTLNAKLFILVQVSISLRKALKILTKFSCSLSSLIRNKSTKH